MCARNFEDKFGLLIRNAIEEDQQKPVKVFPCTYIKSINRSPFLRLKKKIWGKKKNRSAVSHFWSLDGTKLTLYTY